MPSPRPVTAFADVVAASETAAATTKRTAKVAALAELLGRLAPEEVAPAVGFLTGTPRQGRTGVGWATVGAVDTLAASEASLTIDDVDTALTTVAATSGAGSTALRNSVLHELFGRATEAEAWFLRRLLVGELRQGALEGLMTDAVSKAAGVPIAAVRRGAMFAGDLGGAALVALTAGTAGLDTIGLTPLHPVQPMLAGTSPSVAEALAETGPASVEWKLDGARIQVHRVGDEVRVYTRNLNDVTDRLPQVAAAVRAFPADGLVLDGEAIGVGADGRPHLFQDTMSRFGADQVGVAVGLRAFFFDILHVDGTDLVDHPLSERLAVLDRVASGARVPAIVTSDAAEAEAFSADALAHGHEGVMVKALSSTYDAGRRGGAWRKVKPVRTLDLVVLAAEWGHGRRSGWLSNLHLGARSPDGTFVMVGKTFKGMTDELLAWQTGALQERAVRQDDYTVYVRPELVVEIALDGAQMSRRYPGGVALRFARVRGYRPDKDPDDADTIEAVQAMVAR
jgi:DNA ligase-1